MDVMRERLDVVRTCCVIWLCVLFGGCLTPNTSSCGDRLCPRGTLCAATFGQCVTAESMMACAGLTEGTECTTARGNGACRAGVCVPFTCGDGIITAPEECDGDNVGAQTCLTAQFYDDGPVTCAPDCTLDVSQCTGYCGDGVVHASEACDGEPASCQSLGYYDPGVATCTERCTLNAAACTGTCGDDMVNGPEACDGGDPQLQCTSFGYDYGPTSCAGNCAASFLACGRIGWHRDPVTIPIAYLDAIGSWTFGGSYQGSVARFNEHTSYVDVLPGENGLAQGFAGTASDDVYTVTTTGHIYRHDGASWQLVFSTPDGGALSDVHGSASAPMWAVGAAGTIYRLDDMTGTWQADAASGTLTTNDLAAVFSISADDAVAVGAAGTVLVRTAAGWSIVTPAPTVADLGSVWASSPTDVYVGGGRGALLHWDGQAWVPNTELPLITLGAAHQVLITGTSSTNVFVVQSVTNASSGTTIERIWNFDTNDWIEIEPSGHGLGVRDVTITASGQLVVTGIQGAFGIATVVARFHSAGPSLRRPSSPPSIRGTWAYGRDFLVAVGGAEGFLTPSVKHVLMFDGTSWTDDGSSFGPGMFTAVWGFDRTSVFAAAGDGAIWRYDGTWTQEAVATPPGSVYSIWGASATDVFAGAFQGIFHRDSAGVWQKMTLPSTISAPHIWGTSASSVFAVGDGKIFHFDGLTWTDQSPLYAQTLPWLEAVWGTGPANVYAISRTSMLHFDGIAWRDVPGVSATSMIDIAGSGPDDIFVLLEDNSFLHWDGARWAPADSGIAVGATVPSNLIVDTNQWVVSGGANIFGGPRGLVHHSVRTGPGGIGK